MANNYYVHLESGLVFAADECVTVDLDKISDRIDGDDYVDDQTIYKYALSVLDSQLASLPDRQLDRWVVDSTDCSTECTHDWGYMAAPHAETMKCSACGDTQR